MAALFAAISASVSPSHFFLGECIGNSVVLRDVSKVVEKDVGKLLLADFVEHGRRVEFDVEVVGGQVVLLPISSKF